MKRKRADLESLVAKYERALAIVATELDSPDAEPRIAGFVAGLRLAGSKFAELMRRYKVGRE